jgi:hypothetical protein
VFAGLTVATEDDKAAVELSFRQVLAAAVHARRFVPDAMRTLQLALHAVLLGNLDHLAVPLLLDDLFEASPLPDCARAAFDLVEQHLATSLPPVQASLARANRTRLLAGPFNKLLRRVRGADVDLAGRIEVLLSVLGYLPDPPEQPPQQ